MNSDFLRKILARLKAGQGVSIDEIRQIAPRRYFAMDPTTSVNIEPLGDSLLQLVKLSLIEVYSGGKVVPYADLLENPQRRNFRYFISPTTLAIEDCLNIHLDQANSGVFGLPRSGPWPDLFVLMPFEPGLRPVFEDHIKKVATKNSLTAGRADDFFTSGSIMTDIWSAISAARIVIADCTNRNPNVFYELGIAHAIGRNTILISQSIDDVPFDLRHLRTIIYEYTPRGMNTFEERLEGAIVFLESE